MLLIVGIDRFFKSIKNVQTSAREQDVQTDPYSPDYICLSENPPAELAIASFRWQQGLPPAGPAEIRAIKEMRVQWQLTQLLPPHTNDFCLAIRTILMERQEFYKWAQRERDIRELQARLLGPGLCLRPCTFFATCRVLLCTELHLRGANVYRFKTYRSCVPFGNSGKKSKLIRKGINVAHFEAAGKSRCSSPAPTRGS